MGKSYQACSACGLFLFYPGFTSYFLPDVCFLFPQIKEDKVLDFKKYYYENSRYIFLIFTLLMGVYLINNVWIKEHDYYSLDNIYCIAGIVFGLLFSFIKNEIFHTLCFILGSVIFIFYVIMTAVQ